MPTIRESALAGMGNPCFNRPCFVFPFSNRSARHERKRIDSCILLSAAAFGY